MLQDTWDLNNSRAERLHEARQDWRSERVQEAFCRLLNKTRTLQANLFCLQNGFPTRWDGVVPPVNGGQHG